MSDCSGASLNQFREVGKHLLPFGIAGRHSTGVIIRRVCSDEGACMHAARSDFLEAGNRTTLLTSSTIEKCWRESPKSSPTLSVAGSSKPRISSILAGGGPKPFWTDIHVRRNWRNLSELGQKGENKRETTTAPF